MDVGLIRAIVVTIIGGSLIFFVQPWLYQNTFFSPRDVPDVDVWVRDIYRLNANIVFGVSIFSQVAWHFIAHRFRGDEREAPNMKTPWWCFFSFTIITSFVTVYFLGGSGDDRSGDALPSLAFFFFVDVLIIYWLATAISSPRALKYIPPGSLFIRSKLNSWD